MEMKEEFLQSLREDIHSIYSACDFSSLSRTGFHSFMVDRISRLSTKYNLISESNVPVTHEDNSFSYIDVLWKMDSIPVVAFDINTSFRTRSIWPLKNFQALHKIYVFFGRLTNEQIQTLHAIDDLKQITIFEYRDFDRRLLKRHRSKERSSHETSENAKTSPSLTPKKLSESLSTTFNLYNQGYSIKDIANTRNFAESTIVEHLVRIQESGEYVDLSRLIPLEKQNAIIMTSKKLDTVRLKPIKELLGDDYSWGEIKLVLVHNERYDLFE